MTAEEFAFESLRHLMLGVSLAGCGVILTYLAFGIVHWREYRRVRRIMSNHR